MQNEQHKNHSLFCQHERQIGQNNFRQERIYQQHTLISLLDPYTYLIPKKPNYI